MNLDPSTERPYGTHPLNLDVAAPDQVSTVLRAAADAYIDSHNELLAAWQQPTTPWATIARILNDAANRIDRSQQS
jgi:hypothetical protein